MMQRGLAKFLQFGRKVNNFPRSHVKFFSPLYLSHAYGKLTRTFSTSTTIFQEENRWLNVDATVDERRNIQSKYFKETDTGGLSAMEYLNSLDEDDAKRLKVIKLEYEVALASGDFVPEVMTDEDWLQAWDCNGRTQRRKLYRYLGKCEKIEQKNKRLKEERRIKEETRVKEQRVESDGGFVYAGSPKNTLILRIADKQMNQHHSKRCYEALQFGEKIIFDMSYDDLMRPFDITNTVDQVLEAHGVNKLYRDPFYVYFCNAKPDGRFVERLRKSTQGDFTYYPFTVTEKSYLDLFPKENLVYLTPNAKDYLRDYDANKTYIIGGLVDKVVTKPVTMAKAKREELTMAKLPIDLHMRFIMGNKSLCLNQIFGIMCELKKTGNWKEAFKYIPRRKAVYIDETEEFERRTANLHMKRQKLRARRMGYDI
ncbi:tRNA methyltransferase 10 homolog C-like [Lineus longissimus]|uniref:tRNA methyltransferase 10 homolog C-like n=1 Tax=Lineus longissimus TaxID=88925 RepID=UPI002B4FB4FF